MSKLHDILEDQHISARADPGKTIVRRLYGGLRIEMTSFTVGLNTEIRLGITRDDKYPSDQEWKTICDHLPFWSEQKNPERILSQQGRYILTAILKPVNQIKFL